MILAGPMSPIDLWDVCLRAPCLLLGTLGLIVATPIFLAWVAQKMADAASGSKEDIGTGGFEVQSKSKPQPPENDRQSD